MKKLTLCIAFALIGAFSAQGQGAVAGLNAGIPVGDVGDFTTFAIAVELGYLLEVSDEFSVGPKAGYNHFFGDKVEEGIVEIEYDDIQFIPIGGTARFSITDMFSVGTDLGYAVGVNEGNDGGFWYQPFASYGSGSIRGKISYQGISADGWTISSVNAGLEFGF